MRLKTGASEGKMETLNLYPAFVKGHDSGISNIGNQIGVSSLPFGERKTIIFKRLALNLDFKNSLFGGSITHYGIQKEEVLQCMATLINEALGYTTKVINDKTYIQLDNGNYTLFHIESEKALLIEVIDGYFLRMHADIASTFYTIEIKTTNRPKSMWKDLAAYQIFQLNTYMGFLGHLIGFLLKVDLGATKESNEYPSHGGYLNSSSTRMDFIWNKYFLLYPHEFDQELFDYAIEKAKRLCGYLKDNIPIEKISCPEFVFSCNDLCKETCPNPIEKVKMDDNDECVHCKGIIEMGTYGIIRNDKMYHYTDIKGHPHEDCVQACKNQWEVRAE